MKPTEEQIKRARAILRAATPPSRRKPVKLCTEDWSPQALEALAVVRAYYRPPTNDLRRRREDSIDGTARYFDITPPTVVSLLKMEHLPRPATIRKILARKQS